MQSESDGNGLHDLPEVNDEIKDTMTHLYDSTQKIRF